MTFLHIVMNIRHWPLGRISFVQDMKQSGVKLTPNITLAPRFRMSGATTPPPHVSLRGA
jgi:hypothetical protein